MCQRIEIGIQKIKFIINNSCHIQGYFKRVLRDSVYLKAFKDVGWKGMILRGLVASGPVHGQLVSTWQCELTTMYYAAHLLCFTSLLHILLGRRDKDIPLHHCTPYGWMGKKTSEWAGRICAVSWGIYTKNKCATCMSVHHVNVGVSMTQIV